MKIVGLESLSDRQIEDELSRGAKFVVFTYCVSIIVLTFQRESDIHFVRADQAVWVKGIGCTLISLLLGWWGVPWGPIWTVAALVRNAQDGRDVTAHVLGLPLRRAV